MEQAAVLAELKKRVLPDLLSVEDLAAHLRRSPSAIRQLLRQGTIPGRRIGRRWVVSRVALLHALVPARDLPPLRVLAGLPS